MKILDKDKISLKYKDLKDYLDSNPVLSFKENDYNLLPDIDKTINYLKDKQESKIVIYGDYDCDGINASMIMYKGLTSLGYKHINISIPERSEGYGANTNRFNKIIEENNEIVITVDNGISAVNEIELLNKHNITCIVTDHHEPQKVLPNAYAIIDPKRNDSIYPFKEICGATVAYKLMKGLSIELNRQLDDKLITYTGLATLSDSMPILDENKYYVSKALEIINKDSILIKSILTSMNQVNLINNLTEQDLLFYIAPFINSSSRVASIKDCLCMYLFDDDYNKCLSYAYKINEYNNLRKRLSKEHEQLAYSKINKYYPNIYNFKEPIIIYDESFNKGIIGIVAGRIEKDYNVPSIVLTKQDNEYIGSCRSNEKINLIELLDSVKDLLNKAGGHKQAAGISLPADKIDEFTLRIHNYSIDHLPQGLYTSKQEVTCKLELDEATLETIDLINSRRPFGHLNEEPTFYGEYIITNLIKLGKDDKHIKLIVSNEDTNKEILLFNYNKKYLFEINKKIKLTFKLDVNEFRGNKTVQLRCIDLVE